jgi:hypothetical protein
VVRVGRGISYGPAHRTTNPGVWRLAAWLLEGHGWTVDNTKRQKTYVDSQSRRSRRYGFSRRPAALAPPVDPPTRRPRLLPGAQACTALLHGRLQPGLHHSAACMRSIQSASPSRIRPSTVSPSRSFSFAIFLVYRL